MRTKDRLAAELRAVATKANPGNAQSYEALAVRAETGEFDDYGTTHACGVTVLFLELKKRGFDKFAQRVVAGEFDATFEESEEWIHSEEGQQALKDLPVELQHQLLGKRDG